MQLDQYVEAIREDLARVAAVGDEATARTAEVLAGALESSIGRRLQEALAAAALELSAQLQEGRVEVRMAGRDPELVYVDELAPAGADTADEAFSARITLRLPESLKIRLKAAAASAGVSANTWLVQTLSRHSMTPGQRESLPPERRRPQLKGTPCPNSVSPAPSRSPWRSRWPAETSSVVTVEGEQSIVTIDGAPEPVETIKLELVGDRLEIRQRHRPRFAIFGRLEGQLRDVRVSVPHRNSVEIFSASARATLNGTFTGLEMKSASGSLTATGQLEGSARVETVSGDIRLPHVAGALMARTVSGILPPNQSRIRWVAQSVSGNVHVGSLRGGTTTVHSVSGQVDLGHRLGDQHRSRCRLGLRPAELGNSPVRCSRRHSWADVGHPRAHGQRTLPGISETPDLFIGTGPPRARARLAAEWTVTTPLNRWPSCTPSSTSS